MTTSEQQAVPVAQELERLAGECSDDATRHLAIRSPLNRVIFKAVRGFTLSNMVYDDDHHAGYPLVDLMSNPAPCDISTGEMEMVGLADEIQAAIEAAGLSLSTPSEQFAKSSPDAEQGVSVAEYNDVYDKFEEVVGESFRDGFREGWIYAQTPDGSDYDERSEEYGRAVDIEPSEAWDGHRDKYAAMLPVSALPTLKSEGPGR